MNRVRTALVASFALLAAGCAGPSFRRPDAPANAGYSPTPLPEASSSSPTHGGGALRLMSGRDIPFE